VGHRALDLGGFTGDQKPSAPLEKRSPNVEEEEKWPCESKFSPDKLTEAILGILSGMWRTPQTSVCVDLVTYNHPTRDRLQNVPPNLFDRNPLYIVKYHRVSKFPYIPHNSRANCI
jgi:hypothetical protein